MEGLSCMRCASAHRRRFSCRTQEFVTHNNNQPKKHSSTMRHNALCAVLSVSPRYVPLTDPFHTLRHVSLASILPAW